MIKKNVSPIVFFWNVILFCLNLQINFSNDLKITIFWVSIACMFGIVLYQIFYLENNHFILFEIIIIFFLLHLVYQINYYGLIDKDAYIDFGVLKNIINNHHVIITSNNIDVSGWPLLHLFTSFFSIILKIDPLIVAKILPSFIESIIAIPIYLFVYTLSKNKKAALLSCLLFASITQFGGFESLFVRESYALYFLIFCFYILYVAKQRDDHRLLTLSIILIPIIVLSHHFTSFMFIILLLVFIIASKIIPILFNKKIMRFLFNKKEKPNFNKINIGFFFIILLIALLLYWSYFTPFIIKNFFQIYYEAIGIKTFVSYGQQLGINQTIVTLRGNIQYYGFFFFNGILSLILLIAILLKKQKYLIENVTFTIYLFFCLFLGALSLFMGSLIAPDRFLPFGWLFGVIPLTLLLFNLKHTRLKKIIFVIIVSFIIFNIYNIDPKYYTGEAYLNGTIATEKEYAIAETINVSSPYIGYLGVADAIYDVQGTEFRFGAMINPIESSNIFHESNLSIFYKDMYLQILEYEKIKSPVTYNRIITILSYENSNDINKICDTGDIFISTWNNTIPIPSY